MDLRTDLAVRTHGRPPGEAPTLLLIHGLTDSADGWADAVRRWSDRYAVVAYDQRGHGASPRFTPEQLEDSEPHPGDIMVDDALSILGQLPEPPVVVGHSLGGAVALVSAVQRPGLVRALVLEDPAPLGPHEDQRSHRRGSEYAADLQASRDVTDDEALLALRRQVHPDWPADELLPTGHAEQLVDLTYLALGDFKPSPRWPELFEQVAVPTLLISGDAGTRMSELCIDDDVERGLTAIGNDHVRFVRVPGAGHCVRRDRTDRYHAEVDAWLTAQTA